MNWKKHLVFGNIILIILLGLNYHYGLISLKWWEYIILFGLTIIGSTIPDIDIETSKPRRIITIIILLGIIYCFASDKKIFGTVLALLLLGIIFLKHRKFTHSIWFVLLISIPIIYQNYVYGIVLVIAISSHFIADSIKIRKKRK